MNQNSICLGDLALALKEQKKCLGDSVLALAQHLRRSG